MTLTAGALSIQSVSSTSASLVSAVATSGTAPYSYQWYRSTSSGFSPGSGNIISGATNLSLTDTGLIPGTTYFYKVVVTDSAGSPATATSAQLQVVTLAPAQNPNQFSQAPYLGMIDMRFPYNSVAVEIDASQVGAITAGCAVKLVDSAGGVPKVVACSAASDEVFGFINYDIKTVAFSAGMPCEVSMSGNVMYLYATEAVSRGAQVVLSTPTVGGVKPSSSGSSGDNICGWAYDKASAGGQLIRVFLKSPSYAFVP